MSDGLQPDGPPQPILIRGSDHGNPLVSGQEGHVRPEAAPSMMVVGRLGEASDVEKHLAKVRFLLENKPDINNMLALSIVLMFAVPFILLVASDADILLDDGITVCCFSSIAGFVLLLVASHKHSAWNKALQQAKATSVDAAGMSLPEPGDYRKAAVVGSSLFMLGLAFENGVLLLVGLLLPVPWLASRMGGQNDINQAFARLEEQRKKQGQE